MSGLNNATSLSAKFYTHFQELKNDLSTRLEGIASENTGEIEINRFSSDIAKLRKDLIEATPYLPSYDRGKYEQQLKGLEENLSRHRAPKSKFTFKRKQLSTSIPSSATIPREPHTPVPPSTNNLSLASHASAFLTLSPLSNDSAPMPGSSDIILTDLTNCIVDLFSLQTHSSSPQLKVTALHGRGLQRVVLAIPPVEGSVLLHDVQNSIIIVGCHQFRMHDSNNNSVFLHVLSNPIIEGSQNIRFGAYLPALREACASKTDFFTRTSQHEFVQDFDWIKSSPSPNWSIVEPPSELSNNVVQALRVGSGSVNQADITNIIDCIL